MDQPITPRPQLPQSNQPAPRRIVAAQPLGGVMPAPADQAAGLIQGLASLNPALHQLANADIAEAQRKAALADAEAQRNTRVTGKATSEADPDPVKALTGAPVDLPSSVPIAYGREFRESWADNIGERAGAKIKEEALTEYGKLRNTEGFDAAAWLQETRQKALQGVQDPRMVVAVGAHMRELEATVAAETERTRRIVRDQERASTMSALASDMFSADMKADEVSKAYPLFVQRARSIGYMPKEAAAAVFGQLTHQSNLAGGLPELFDVFERKDPTTGQRLLDLNPELVPHVDAARKQAQDMRDKATREGAEQSNGKVLDAIEKDIDANPSAVTPERLLAHFTKFGAIQSPQQYASILDRARTAQLKALGAQELDALYGRGELWRLEAGKQNKVLDARLGPAVEVLAEANRTGNLEGVAQVAAQIMQAHSRSGATVPFDQLKGFLATNVTNLPSPSGASAGFKASAELYKAMSGNPQYRDLYFSEDLQKVLGAYVAGTSSGTDEKAAYTQAYQSVSPEAKKAAEEFASTPEFRKLIENDARKFVTGSSWVPRWMGGGGRPENQGVVGASLAGELRSWRARNPFATDKDAEEHAEQWTSRNFVLDKTTGSAIKVPPGMSGNGAAEAFTEYSADAVKRLQLGERSDAPWRVQYIPTGTEGTYTAVAFNGSASKVIAPVNLQGLIAEQSAKKVLTPEDKVQLGALRGAVANGEKVPNIDPKVIAKAEALGVIQPEESRRYREAANKQFLERLKSIPGMDLGDPSLVNLQANPARPYLKVDSKATARAALELLANPMTSGHMNLAASLTTMGEAMALRRYSDPAYGAGENIGMGYNLKANAKTADDDLRRAGVPVDVIGKVKDGSAELTPDQAKRLLMVTLPRYEQSVKETAESTSPGLWARMQPQQRAVMLDIAYQVGPAGAEQFRKAWTALASGDSKTFADSVRVTYKNRSGERVEDTRRNSLRAAMLAGQGTWEAAVQQYAALPSTKLDSVALQGR